MSTFTLGAVAIVIISILGALYLIRKLGLAARRPARPLYQRTDGLFTKAEAPFFHALHQAVGDRYRVMGKVRLLDLVEPSRGLPPSPRQTAFNKVSGKHVDFVLCDARSLAPVCVVELDDSSHQRRDRAERDQFVEGVLAQTGLPLVRVAAQRSYDVGMLRRAVLTGLAGPVTVEPSDATTLAPAIPPQPEPAPAAPASSAPACPQCGGPMTLRKAARGQNAGSSFWGCNRYPACRGKRQPDTDRAQAD